MSALPHRNGSMMVLAEADQVEHLSLGQIQSGADLAELFRQSLRAFTRGMFINCSGSGAIFREKAD